MPKDIYLEGEDIKFVDGVQTTPRKLDEVVKGSHSAHKTRHQNGGADEIDVGGLNGLLADSQTPLAHKTSHESGGGDAIKLDDLSTPDDNVDLNASITKHGLLPKLANDVAKFLTGLGTWIKPKLDDLDEPDDNTDLNASTIKHGLLPKMDVMITDLDADKVDGKNASDLVQMTGIQTIAGVKTFGDTPKMDAIAEKTGDVGVTVDGVLIKDSLDISGIVDKASVQTIVGKKTFSNDIIFSGDKIIQTNVKARAYLSANQENLVHDTWTKVLLDAESYDIGNDFASYKFVAPVAGYYFIHGALLLTNVISGKPYDLAIYKNGVVIITYSVSSPTTASFCLSISDIQNLAQNDYIELFVRSKANADTVDIFGTEMHTFLTIHLLSI